MSPEEWIEVLERNTGNVRAVRVELESTSALESFERLGADKLVSLMKAAELASMSPTATWYQMAGIWPGAGDGWILLLRVATFKGNAAPPDTRRDVRRPGR